MRLAWLFLLAACGRVGFDASGDAVGERDAAFDAPPPCTGLYGPPRNLSEINAVGDEHGGFLTDDTLELYFGSDRLMPGTFDLYVAKRSVPSGPFDPPVRLDLLASAFDEDDPYIEPDGLTMWFGVNGNIATTERASRTAPWGPSSLVPNVSTLDYDISPALSPDGLFLYMASSPGAAYDLYVSQRASTSDVFPAPSLVGAVNTALFECCPHVSGDGTQLWFTTTSFAPQGQSQIAVVTRDPATGALAGTPVLDPLFDSAFEDLDMFVTRDGNVLGFTSTRPGGSGGHDLYLIERSCP